MRGSYIKFTKIVAIISIIIFVFSACSNKQETETGNEAKVEVEKSSTITSQPKKNKISACEECVELVNKIVRNSDYDTYFKENYNRDYSILIDEATKEKVTIQIVIENDVPMGWLELLINQGTLNDITNDPEEPKNLNGDVQMMRNFKQNCLQCCLD